MLLYLLKLKFGNPAIGRLSGILPPSFRTFDIYTLPFLVSADHFIRLKIVITKSICENEGQSHS